MTEQQVRTTQNKRQLKAVQNWNNETKGRGTVIGPTGFGKSWVGKHAVEKINGARGEIKTFIVVPFTSLVTQWNSYELPNTEVVTIQALTRNPEVQECDLLIVDEVHKFGSDVFGKVFELFKYTWILCLTATLERKDGKHRYIERYAPVADTVTVAEAVQNQWILDVLECNLTYNLSGEDQQKYDQLNKAFKKAFAKLNFDFDLVRACTKLNLKNGQRNPRVVEYANISGMTMHGVVKAANDCQKLSAQRKQLLYNNENKLVKVKTIVKEFPDKNLIFFGESVSFAERILQEVTGEEKAVFIRSGMKKSERAEAERKVKEGVVQYVVSAKALDTGFDAPNLEIGVNCSYNSGKTSYKQRRGRICRTADAEKTPILINLVAPGTQEEKWLDGAQAESPHVKQSYWISDLLRSQQPNIIE